MKRLKDFVLAALALAAIAGMVALMIAQAWGGRP